MRKWQREKYFYPVHGLNQEGGIVKENTDKIFESYMLTSLSVRQYGHLKTCHELAQAGADHTGIKRERAKGQIILLDETLMRDLRRPVSQARTFMKDMCPPWASSRTDNNGSRISGNKYLLKPSDLDEYEQGMSKYRENWEQGLENRLFSRWNDLRNEADVYLKGRFQEYFIPVEDLRRHFEWHVSLEPLMDVWRIEEDIRLKAPKEVLDRCVADARREQTQKIANVVGNIADKVLAEAGSIVDGIDEYVYNEKNNKKGNSLPKAPGWRKLEKLADQIDDWRKALDDEDLSDVADGIRDLVRDIEEMGDGDLAKARSVLSGDDDTKRQEVRKKLTDIQKSASPATNKLEDWLSD